MASSDEIVAAARACLGTPFGHQGRIPGQRLDCVGLLIAVANQTGLEDGFDFTNYPRFPFQDQVRQWLTARMGPTLAAGIAAARDADIILLADQRWACHTAWLASRAGRRTMIHAYAPARMVVEHGIDEHWAARIRGVWRHPRLSEVR